MNTSSNRKLHQLTSKASSVTNTKPKGATVTVTTTRGALGAAAGSSTTAAAKSAKKVSLREERTDDDELMLDPAVILNYRKQDYRHITECHMGKKGIERVHPNTQSFINLEILWLNDNKLTRIDGLLPPTSEASLSEGVKGCVRLKRLYLNNNRLNTLIGDIHRLKYLEVLLLANNRLSNLEGVSAQLTHLRFLQQLDLYGNPLSEEANYREYFIHEHPSVILFDKLTVKDEERQKAAQLFAQEKRQAGGTSHTLSATGFGTTVPAKKFTAKAGLISPSVAIIEGRVKQIKIRDAAAAEYEETKEETLYNRRAERRAVYHSLWGDKEPASVGSGKVNDRPGMSRLFDEQGNDPNSDVNALIDLKMEINKTENPERKAELEALLKKKKSKLFPSRLGDGFAGALVSKQMATADITRKEYEDRVIQAFFSTEEQQTLNRLFGEEKMSIGDIISLQKVISVPEDAMDLRGWADYVKTTPAAHPGLAAGGLGQASGARSAVGGRSAASVVSGASGSGAAGNKLDTSPPQALDLRTAMVILTHYEPYVRGRWEQLTGAAQLELIRKGASGAGGAAPPPPGAAGGGAQAATSLAKLNFLFEHAEKLKRNGNGVPDASHIVPGAKGPSAFKEEQQRLGSAVGALLAKHSAKR